MTKNRKKIVPAAVVIAAGAILLLTGCIDVETHVFVNKDGSGEVKQTMMMKSEFVEMIGAMKGEENYSLLNEKELRGKSAEMGRGVSFVSAEPVQSGGFSGYTARYTFDDIESLRLNQNPGDDLPDEASEGGTVRELISFEFQEGRTSTLTIHMPAMEEEPSKNRSGSNGDMPENEELEFIEAFNKLYKDMRMVMKISVDGTIRSTNASYREGDTVTLMEIDFSAIAEDAELIKELARSEPETTEELKAFMQNVPGMKAELEEEVRIEFRCGSPAPPAAGSKNGDRR